MALERLGLVARALELLPVLSDAFTDQEWFDLSIVRVIAVVLLSHHLTASAVAEAQID